MYVEITVVNTEWNGFSGVSFVLLEEGIPVYSILFWEIHNRLL